MTLSFLSLLRSVLSGSAEGSSAVSSSRTLLSGGIVRFAAGRVTGTEGPNDGRPGARDREGPLPRAARVILEIRLRKVPTGVGVRRFIFTAAPRRRDTRLSFHVVLLKLVVVCVHKPKIHPDRPTDGPTGG